LQEFLTGSNGGITKFIRLILDKNCRTHLIGLILG
jgi:hypothetical protein